MQLGQTNCIVVIQVAGSAAESHLKSPITTRREIGLLINSLTGSSIKILQPGI